ncbi:putative Chromosome-associated kinesin KIF4 [Blattamonas nauphoetae]|uniref:Chromosome-associated kinesin KIF4 n=1 Tax=Blattamonas nauphoetae TaxID=2049346 RepID=A0ABQ9YM19_9EUKA|nr:putative Chromosome-associated kinesin KIF4 [Blattamonas nauphoetae]
MSRPPKPSSVSRTSDAGRNENDSHIQVVIRARPPLPTEIPTVTHTDFTVFVPTTSSQLDTGEWNTSKQRQMGNMSKNYSFSHVYGQNTSQEELFNEIVAPVVDETLKGYNCTVFAYGQTGTGKTYTMIGANGEDGTLDSNQLGIIPRAIHRIFSILTSACITSKVISQTTTPKIHRATSPNPKIRASTEASSEFANQAAQALSLCEKPDVTMWELNGGNPVNSFTVSVSNLEIYKEDVIDLLAPGTINSQPPPFGAASNGPIGAGFMDSGRATVLSSSSHSNQFMPTRNSFSFSGPEQKKPALRVMQKGENEVEILGAETKVVTNVADALFWLEDGNKHRVTSDTLMNRRSSRSHSIFTVTVEIKETTQTGEERTVIGKLNLVDLAGSENVERSGADQKQTSEAGSINKSLLALGQVINALAHNSTLREGGKKEIVRYRDSNLTRLLQNSLGGNNKTTLIATISLGQSNLDVTNCTLDFASRTQTVQNKPVANLRLTKKNVNAELQKEIDRLKKQLRDQWKKDGVKLSQEEYDRMEEAREERQRVIQELQRDLAETRLVLTQKAMVNDRLQHETDSIAKQMDELQSVFDQQQDAINLKEQAVQEYRMAYGTIGSRFEKARRKVEELHERLNFQDGNAELLHDKINRMTDNEIGNQQRVNQLKNEMLQRVVALSEGSGRVTTDMLNDQSSLQNNIEGVIRAMRDTQMAGIQRTSQAFTVSEGVFNQLTNTVAQIPSFLQQKINDIHTITNEGTNNMIGLENSFGAHVESMKTTMESQFGIIFNNLGKLSQSLEQWNTQVSQNSFAEAESSFNQLLMSTHQSVQECMEFFSAGLDHLRNGVWVQSNTRVSREKEELERSKRELAEEEEKIAQMKQLIHYFESRVENKRSDYERRFSERQALEQQDLEDFDQAWTKTKQESISKVNSVMEILPQTANNLSSITDSIKSSLSSHVRDVSASIVGQHEYSIEHSLQQIQNKLTLEMENLGDIQKQSQQALQTTFKQRLDTSMMELTRLVTEINREVEEQTSRVPQQIKELKRTIDKELSYDLSRFDEIKQQSNRSFSQLSRFREILNSELSILTGELQHNLEPAVTLTQITGETPQRPNPTVHRLSAQSSDSASLHSRLTNRSAQSEMSRDENEVDRIEQLSANLDSLSTPMLIKHLAQIDLNDPLNTDTIEMDY